MKLKKENVAFYIAGIFLFLSIAGIGSGIYFYKQYKDSEKKLSNPTEAAKLENQALIKKVAKLMVLPNEEAQVATVVDVENLKKTQPFFADAMDNDKLLLFNIAKKAILYRPSTNVIVNVAPIIDNEGTPSAQTNGTNTQALRIALRNGSGVTGITKKLEDELKTKLQNVTITERDNAKRQDYEKTTIIALTDTLNKTFVQQLANELSATVSSLPSDEPKPDADLLIIAGKDRK